jgi:hypothetical protein
MNQPIILSFALFTALAGCASTPSGPVRIDGSSPQACDASWKLLQLYIAKAFYERIGFVVVETTPERYFMEWVP